MMRCSRIARHDRPRAGSCLDGTQDPPMPLSSPSISPVPSPSTAALAAPTRADARDFSIWNPRAWLMFAPGELPTLLWIIGVHVALVVGLVLLPLPPLSA